MRDMKNTERSVTLVQVTMGFVALVVVMFLSTPKLRNPGIRGKSQIAKIQIKELEGAIQLFRFDTQRYPTSDEGLDALIHNPGNLKSWRGPYLSHAQAPKDPWGRPYIYRCQLQNGTYDLICYGQDGVPGGDGDAEDILLLNREFPK